MSDLRCTICYNYIPDGKAHHTMAMDFTNGADQMVCDDCYEED